MPPAGCFRTASWITPASALSARFTDSASGKTAATSGSRVTTFAPLTYRDLQRQLDTVRRQLRLAGFDAKARIGVLMPNGAEAVLAIVAVACCSVAVPLDPRLSQAEIDQRLDLLRLNALLVPQRSAFEARQAAQRRRLAVIEAAPNAL